MACRKCKQEIPADAIFCPWCGVKQEKKKSVKARGNGTGTVYKRGRTYTAKVTLGMYIDANGKRKVISATRGGFQTKAEAINYLPMLISKQKKEKAPVLSYYWELYLGSDMERLSDSKRTAYKIAWNKLKRIHNLRVDVISVSDLRSVVEKTCPSYYTAKDVKTLLAHLFELAGADGWVNKNLPSYIKLPELKEVERLPFTAQEQGALWRAYENGVKDAAIPLIMIYTGMMPGEMRRLSTEMIDLPGRQIVGVGLKTKVRKKSSVILPDDICPVLEGEMEGVDGLLYPMTETSFYARYYKALEVAGTRRLTPYSCRHTTATTYTITENTPPQLVTRIMRWSSSKMMDRYVHPSDEDARVAAKAMKRPPIINALETK